MEDKQVYIGNSSRGRLNLGLNSQRVIILPLLRLLLKPRRLHRNPRIIRTNLQLGILSLMSLKQLLRLSSRWPFSNPILPLPNNSSHLSHTILNLTRRCSNLNSRNSIPGTIAIFIIRPLTNLLLPKGRVSKTVPRIQEEETSSNLRLSLSSSRLRLRKVLRWVCMDLDKIRVMDEEEELGRWEAEEVELVGIEVAVVLAGEEVVEEVVL
jgi:hypothetical protein